MNASLAERSEDSVFRTTWDSSDLFTDLFTMDLMLLWFFIRFFVSMRYMKFVDSSICGKDMGGDILCLIW